LIPVILMALLWGIPIVYGTFGVFVSALAGLVGLGVGLFFARKKFQPRTLAAVAVVCAALLSLQISTISAKDWANHPVEMQGREFEMAPVEVLLDNRLSDGFWQGRIVSLFGNRQSVETLVSDKDDSDFQIGCKLIGVARLVPNDDFARPWLLKVDTRNQEVQCSQSGPTSALRKNFMQSVSGVSSQSAALVAGLSIGDTTMLSPELEQNMKELSLTHLTAVSGANCAIVLGLVFFLLGFLGVRRWQRVLISIICMYGYVQLVGPQPSVLRAATMTAVIVLLTATGRSITPFAGLAHASSLLLIWDPYMAFSLGFALSVAATGGILIVTPWLYSRLKASIGRPLAAMVSVSLAAQIWCTPFLLQLQGGIPTYSLLANVLVEPAVAPITVLGIVSCAVSAISAPLASSVSWLASVPAEYIVVVSNKLSSLPVGTLWWPSGLLGVALMSLLAVAATLFAMNKRKRLAAGLVAVTFVFVAGSGGAVVAKTVSWPQANWVVTNCDVGQGDALVIRSQGLIAVVDVGREPQPIDNCLTRLAISKIDLLVLTHFDADHIGGLSGALQNRQVNLALLPDFQDERSQAKVTEYQVRAKARQVARVHSGMKGMLGDIQWLVLQPEVAGFGSEDSNDASIAMLWENPDFILATIADLGERGQMRMAELHPDWIKVDPAKPLILKVSHHGSADQYPELTEYWKPTVALISVGANNGYGHPTARTLHTLETVGSRIFRTDLDGAISVAANEDGQGLSVATGG